MESLKRKMRNVKCEVYRTSHLTFHICLCSGPSKISNFELIRDIAEIVAFIESFIV